eukprot:gene9630-251_t
MEIRKIPDPLASINQVALQQVASRVPFVLERVAEETILIIVQYLLSIGFTNSAMVLRDEANMRDKQLRNTSKHCHNLRASILDGLTPRPARTHTSSCIPLRIVSAGPSTCLSLFDHICVTMLGQWAEAESRLGRVSLPCQGDFQFHLLRQQYLELIEAQEHHAALNLILTRLKSHKSTADHADEMSALSKLLICRSIQEGGDSLKHWTAEGGRQSLVDELDGLMQSLSRKDAASAGTPPNRLQTLLGQAARYQVASLPRKVKDGLGLTSILSDYSPVSFPNQLCKEYYGHSDSIKCVQFLELTDATVLITGSNDNSIAMWDIDHSPSPTAHIHDAHKGLAVQLGKVWCLSAAQSSHNLFASGGADGAVKLWEAASSSECNLKGAIEVSADDLYTVALYPDGSHLICGGFDKQISMCDLEHLKTLYRFPCSRDSIVTTAQFNLHGNLGIVGHRNGCIDCYELTAVPTLDPDDLLLYEVYGPSRRPQEEEDEDSDDLSSGPECPVPKVRGHSPALLIVALVGGYGNCCRKRCTFGREETTYVEVPSVGPPCLCSSTGPMTADIGSLRRAHAFRLSLLGSSKTLSGLRPVDSPAEDHGRASPMRPLPDMTSAFHDAVTTCAYCPDLGAEVMTLRSQTRRPGSPNHMEEQVFMWKRKFQEQLEMGNEWESLVTDLQADVEKLTQDAAAQKAEAKKVKDILAQTVQREQQWEKMVAELQVELDGKAQQLQDARTTTSPASSMRQRTRARAGSAMSMSSIGEASPHSPLAAARRSSHAGDVTSPVSPPHPHNLQIPSPSQRMRTCPAELPPVATQARACLLLALLCYTTSLLYQHHPAVLKPLQKTSSSLSEGASPLAGGPGLSPSFSASPVHSPLAHAPEGGLRPVKAGLRKMPTPPPAPPSTAKAGTVPSPAPNQKIPQPIPPKLEVTEPASPPAAYRPPRAVKGLSMASKLPTSTTLQANSLESPRAIKSPRKSPRKSREAGDVSQPTSKDRDDIPSAVTLPAPSGSSLASGRSSISPDDLPPQKDSSRRHRKSSTTPDDVRDQGPKPSSSSSRRHNRRRSSASPDEPIPSTK